MAKTNPGRFFEDYRIGEVITHAVPRTVSGGERAMYHALYPARHALYSSDEFARECGLDASPFDDLAAFHVVFGKSVPDISLNAVANLGYAEGRWLKPVWPGDTLRSESKGSSRTRTANRASSMSRRPATTSMTSRCWNTSAGSWCGKKTLAPMPRTRWCRS